MPIDLDFSVLARVSTPRKSRFKGMLMPLSTIVTLLLVALSIAGAMWLWSAFSAGVLFKAKAFLPFMEDSLLAVIGGVTAFAVANFMFNAHIQYFMLGVRDILVGDVFDEDRNPVNVHDLVEHLRQEINVHFKKVYGDKHVDMPMPLLGVYTGVGSHITTIEGRSPHSAALYFPDSFFRSRKTRMTQRHLAALIQLELVKIYMRRGATRSLFGIGSDLAETVQNLDKSSWAAFRYLGMFAGPFLNFCFLFPRALERTYEYEAAREVVKIGRGLDLHEAIDLRFNRGVHPRRMKTKQMQRDLQKQKMRKPYQGWFTPYKVFANWVDRNEMPFENKSISREMRFLEICVKEGGNWVKELFSSKPRTTNLKAYMRTKIYGNPIGRTLDNATLADLPSIDAFNRERNAQLGVNTYDVISPTGMGVRDPVIPYPYYFGGDVSSPSATSTQFVPQFKLAKSPSLEGADERAANDVSHSNTKKAKI